MQDEDGFKAVPVADGEYERDYEGNIVDEDGELVYYLDENGKFFDPKTDMRSDERLELRDGKLVRLVPRIVDARPKEEAAPVVPALEFGDVRAPPVYIYIIYCIYLSIF